MATAESAAHFIAPPTPSGALFPWLDFTVNSTTRWSLCPIGGRAPTLAMSMLSSVRITSLLTYLLLHSFNGPFSGTTQVSRYQKCKTNLDFNEARDNEWQWHQLGRMQVCTSLQSDNHASTPPLSFLQAGCPSCRPTNSVKALKGFTYLLTCM